MAFTGEQHQFESLEAAMTYLNERGILTFWGWEGQTDGYYFYSFVAQTGIKYKLAVSKNGLVRIMK